MTIILILIVMGLFLWGVFAYGEDKTVGANPVFKRISEVEGALSTDTQKILTYNKGYLAINKEVEMHFYNNSSSVMITDIIYRGQSIFSYNLRASTYKEKAEFAVQTLKRNANHGYLSMSIVREVEEIVLDVDNLNNHLKEGKVRIMPNNDFAWV